MHKFCHWDRLREEVSCLLNKQLFAISIFRNNYTCHTRKTEYIHLAEWTVSNPYHINRLVEMLVHIHSFLSGYLDGFVYDPLEFPISRITHCTTKVTGTPVFVPVFILAAYILKWRCHLRYVVIFTHCYYFLNYSTMPNSFRYTSISLSSSARLASNSFISAITALISIGSSSSKVST